MSVQDELASDERDRRRRAIKDSEAFETLLKHPGWEAYLRLIEAVAQNYYKTTMMPLENVFEVTKTEHAKGTLYGLNLAASLPHAKIQEAKELRDPDAEENG